MRRSSFDPSLARAAAALAVGIVAAAAPLHAQGGVIQVRPSMTHDSVILRMITPNMRAQVESIMVIMRQLDETPASSESSMRLHRELGSLFSRLSGRGRGGAVFMRSNVPVREVEFPRLKGWIGANIGMAPKEETADSTGHFVHYFSYPSIISVDPESPAKRAGIAPGDVLIAFDGQDVVRSRVNLGEMFIPERRLEVTVRRDGENRAFSLVVVPPPKWIAERRAMPDTGRVMERRIVRGMVGNGPPPPFPPRPSGEEPVRVVVGSGVRPAIAGRMLIIEQTGVFGASLVTVDGELASKLNLEKGVLVQQCADETPAFKAGLRTGDVIVSVAGVQVFTAGDVQMMVRSRIGEGTVLLQVVRDKKAVAVNLKR